jgi:TonB-dependent receptor
MKRLTLIGGVRYEKTTEDYARLTTAINGVYKHFKDQYGSVLPSVHVKYELAKDLFLRASVSKTIARPSPSDIYGAETRDDINLTINQPNPGLKALESTNYDVSLDWYSGPLGQFMVGAFQKDITNFPLSVADTITIDGKLYARTSIQPKADGQIKGYEISFRRNLDFLPGFLSGLGVDLNYCKIDSELRVASRPDNPGLPDQPAYVMNLSAYYAYKGFFARVASSQEGEMINRGAAALPINDEVRDPIHTWDFSASYELGRKNSYQLFFEWRNITNAPDTSHFRGSGILVTRTDSGSNVGAGIRFRY